MAIGRAGPWGIAPWTTRRADCTAGVTSAPRLVLECMRNRGDAVMDNPNILLSKVEAAGLWAYFHRDWLLQIRVLLGPQLPPEYFVFVESEAILIAPDPAQVPRPVLPDVSLARPDCDRAMKSPRQTDRGTAALIELDEPCELLSQYTLLIRRAPENRVVAALELLSPSNKGTLPRAKTAFSISSAASSGAG